MDIKWKSNRKIKVIIQVLWRGLMVKLGIDIRWRNSNPKLVYEFYDLISIPSVSHIADDKSFTLYRILDGRRNMDFPKLQRQRQPKRKMWINGPAVIEFKGMSETTCYNHCNISKKDTTWCFLRLRTSKQPFQVAVAKDIPWKEHL